MNINYLPKKIIFSVLGLFLFVACQNTKSRPTSTEIIKDTLKSVHQFKSIDKNASRLKTYFEKLAHKSGFSGAVLIGQDGKTVYKDAFGFANLQNKSLLTTATPFQLASVSKQFTSASIMLLKEKGLLNYEDSVQKFFPDFPYHGISIRLLLEHRSGLPNYIYFCDSYVKDKVKPINNAFAISLMKVVKPPVYFPPDRRFDYSNTGYMILASIVEKVSGVPFASFLHSNIFKPLGMNDTYLATEDDQRKQRSASGYSRGRRSVGTTFLDGVIGDKGIYSSVEDLFKWDQALYDGKLLKDQTLNEAFEPKGKKAEARENYGYGWRMFYWGDVKVIYHAGWWEGFQSLLIRIPEDRITIAVLKNRLVSSAPAKDSILKSLYPLTKKINQSASKR